MPRTRLLIATLACLVCCTGQLMAQQSNPSDSQKEKSAVAHEDLDALLWIQTSAEYEAITRQTFRLAEMNLGSALVDPAWTASTEQQRRFAKKPRQLAALPPAVILDVDETVLDNTAYQTRLIEKQEEFSRESWLAYVREEASPGIPGAKEFIQACRDARVTVLYVTNREFEVEYATRRNLIKTGLLHEDDPDVVFTKYERETWTSDKQTRRAHLATRYRILMMLGDDLNDFITLGKHPASEKRRHVATQYADWWGQRWMALPNPNYGGWERSVYGWKDSSSRETKLKLKREMMRD